MNSAVKQTLLVIGDIAVYYGSLLLTLFIRYGEIRVHSELFAAHALPFTLGLIVWLMIFYIGGLYEKVILKNGRVLNRRFFSLTGLGAATLAMFFYFVPVFGIAPKINLLIFVAIFTVAGYIWRYGFNLLQGVGLANRKTRILLSGDNETAREIIKHLAANPQLGYEVATDNYNLIVMSNHVQRDSAAMRELYHSFIGGIEVISLSDFYEELFDCVSIGELEDAYLVSKLPPVARTYQLVKYSIESLTAFVLLVILLPIIILVAIFVKLTSAGTVFYRQQRVGKNEEVFNLYKFRSMYSTTDKNPDAQSGSPTWSTSGDSRVTPFGRFLRGTHIDEIPQLFNILLGEMSFIGPRPERPEFTKQLEQKIPYYELRSLVKPGITGWAQINYRYGASVEDAYQKLQYDIYYLKNRSFFLDLQILAKTIKKIFV